MEQTNAQPFGSINLSAIDADTAVGNAQYQFSGNNTLDIDPIGYFLTGRQNLASELHLTAAQRPATALITLPAQEKAYQLPHGVKTQAAWHDRIARKVAVKEPQVRCDVQFGNNFAFAVGAAFVGDMGNAIQH